MGTSVLTCGSSSSYTWRCIVSHRQPVAEAQHEAVADLQLVAATFVLGVLLHLQLAALHDLDGVLGLVAGALGDVLDLVDNVVALEDLAEHDVLAIQPRGDGGGDEELGAVGVLAGVGHAWISVSIAS